MAAVAVAAVAVAAVAEAAVAESAVSVAAVTMAIMEVAAAAVAAVAITAVAVANVCWFLSEAAVVKAAAAVIETFFPRLLVRGRGRGLLFGSPGLWPWPS